ncbi:nucleotidyltransferase family protein [Bradyrhizobium pachyrhizi]|uniref:nucleotidyltransferase family protein n=1 Tax=Bradyrhizobium pachyrhizi TaxID=280333 RepID=UPI00067D21DA|nr:nucleotidyltransferase family protein [Bradyrhizobium pachyrhizi]
MRTVEDVANFVGDQPLLTGLLRSVATLAIDDCWIGAGVIRNAVWDHLHGYSIELLSGSDVDVVYCDHSNVNSERDVAIERRLTNDRKGIPWSVRNQARMYERNGDVPYRDSEDAVRCWPETATAVAAKLSDGRVEIMAPHGIDDLLHMIIRPTPVFRTKLSVYNRRIASKDWARRWPRLTFL